MSTVATRKCVRHTGREAVARCVACQRDFCGECSVEHAGQLFCADCLAVEIAAAARRQGGGARWLSNAAVSAACFVLLWTAFYGVGQALKHIPPKVHEGTIWRTPGVP